MANFHFADFCSRDDILALVESRWKFMSRPIHGMAALLHPFYKTPGLFHEQTLMTLKDKYIGRMFDEEEQLQIDAELCSYINNLGPSFSRAVALRPEATSLALTWWQSYGRQGLPRLTTLALRILSQVTFLSSLESLSLSLVASLLVNDN